MVSSRLPVRSALKDKAQRVPTVSVGEVSLRELVLLLSLPFQCVSSPLRTDGSDEAAHSLPMGTAAKGGVGFTFWQAHQQLQRPSGPFFFLQGCLLSVCQLCSLILYSLPFKRSVCPSPQPVFKKTSSLLRSFGLLRTRLIVVALWSDFSDLLSAEKSFSTKRTFHKKKQQQNLVSICDVNLLANTPTENKYALRHPPRPPSSSTTHLVSGV